MRVVKLRDSDLMKPVALALGLEVLFNVLWLVVDPLRLTQHASAGNPHVPLIVCDCQTIMAWHGVTFFGKMCLVIWAVKLTSAVRNAPGEFNEVQALSAALSNIALCGIVILPLVYFQALEQSPAALYLLKSLITFCTRDTEAQHAGSQLHRNDDCARGSLRCLLSCAWFDCVVLLLCRVLPVHPCHHHHSQDLRDGRGSHRRVADSDDLRRARRGCANGHESIRIEYRGADDRGRRTEAASNGRGTMGDCRAPFEAQQRRWKLWRRWCRDTCGTHRRQRRLDCHLQELWRRRSPRRGPRHWRAAERHE